MTSRHTCQLDFHHEILSSPAISDIPFNSPLKTWNDLQIPTFEHNPTRYLMSEIVRKKALQRRLRKGHYLTKIQ